MALTSVNERGIVAMPVTEEVVIMPRAARYTAKLKFQVVLEA
ncbi:MAG TPA: hypothetical protein VEY91_06235 [Candidatus Limnocylindria bacterium]|nr:hypothetical protein [Candidatus Limnocylindria bacterium]